MQIDSESESSEEAQEEREESDEDESYRRRERFETIEEVVEVCEEDGKGAGGGERVSEGEVGAFGDLSCCLLVGVVDPKP